MQLLGGRIIGVGGHGLDLLNSILGLPKTLSSAAFYPLQKSLSQLVVKIAKKSCDRAANELHNRYNIQQNDLLPVEVSYDGAYQRRGGSKGGGNSRYCFASAISTES